MRLLPRPMTAASARSPAKILADRLNLVPIALFSVWAGSMLIFWGQAFGPLLPFAAPPFAWAPLPWLALSLAAAMATRWLPAGWYRLRPFELSGRFYRLIGARRAHIRQFFLANRIHDKVMAFIVHADNHAFIKVDAGIHEDFTAFLKAPKRISDCFAGIL